LAHDLTPAQRTLRARLGAYSRIAAPDYNGVDATRPAKAAYWAKYYAEVDPAGQLAPAERDRKAKAAWQRDMLRARLAKRGT
jgi:hypothetical protein